MENQSIAKFIRLKTGDDIIAEAFETGDATGDYITVINPLKAMYVPATSTGYLQIAFMPWVYPRICDQQEFNIKREEVLLYQDVTDNMNEYYWESVEHYLAAKREKVEEIQEEKIDEEIMEELLEEIRKGRVMH
jgi:hypothetical protein